MLPAALALAAGARAEVQGPPPLKLEVVAHALEHPLDVASPAGDSRLFVVEQPGRIRIVKQGRLLPAAFLDLTHEVRSGGERGLLSLAFHPAYASNGWLFVNYTDRDGDTRIVRFHVSSDPDRADPASGRLVIRIEQPYSNHNGGMIRFGPDHLLYVGMGDGGSEGDPHHYGQNPATLLGKMLRLDVDHGDPYSVPAGNPFVGRAGFRPEIWALGLRNPWRFCFDRGSGMLIIADVGQNQWEEIDAVPWERGGWNFGWNLMEGRHAYEPGTASVLPLTGPVEEYSHSTGCSIIGGFVYHGRALPELDGFYLYSDYCDRTLHGLRLEHGRVAERRQWNVHATGAISSFGEDANGELYLTTFDGRVSRLVRAD